MNNQIVTVFGGSGFLGRHAVRSLAQAGYRLRIAVRKPYVAGFIAAMGEVGQIQLVQASIRSDKAVAEAVRDAHAVVNLVGASPPWGGEGFKALHLDGAARVAQMAMDAGAQILVQISALGASFEAPSRRLRMRARGEAMVRDRFPGATILRSARAFGPEDKFFNRIAARARTSPFLALAAGGRSRLQPVFAGDVARAIVRSVSDPATARGRTYELAGPSMYSERELVGLVLKEIRRERAIVDLPGRAQPDEMMRKGALSLFHLGIAPTPMGVVVPAYLSRFRPKGQYEDSGPAPTRMASFAAVGPSVSAALWTGRAEAET